VQVSPQVRTKALSSVKDAILSRYFGQGFPKGLGKDTTPIYNKAWKSEKKKFRKNIFFEIGLC